MVTPQTNCTLDEIADALRDYDNIYICGHQGPDGDCLGATLGLYHVLKSLGKNVKPLFASGFVPQELLTLPGSENLIEACDVKEPCETFIMVDAPDCPRMSDAAELLFKQAKHTITVDHHAHPVRVSELSYTDPDTAATCVLVWQLAKRLMPEPSVEVATCCFSGTLTDTGCFRFQNANEEAFRLSGEMVGLGADAYFAAQTLLASRTAASLKLECRCIENMVVDIEHGIVASTLSKEEFEACDAVKADVDPLVNTLRDLNSIRVVALFYEQDDAIRVSMRSKDDTDVSKIARLYGGGGHKAAAGCTMDGDLITCRNQVIQDIIRESCSQ